MSPSLQRYSWNASKENRGDKIDLARVGGPEKAKSQNTVIFVRTVVVYERFNQQHSMWKTPHTVESNPHWDTSEWASAQTEPHTSTHTVPSRKQAATASGGYWKSILR